MTNYYDELVNHELMTSTDPNMLLDLLSCPIKGSFGRMRFGKIEHDPISLHASFNFPEHEYINDIGKQCEIEDLKIAQRYSSKMISLLKLIQNIHEIASPDDKAKVIDYLTKRANKINNIRDNMQEYYANTKLP